MSGTIAVSYQDLNGNLHTEQIPVRDDPAIQAAAVLHDGLLLLSETHCTLIAPWRIVSIGWPRPVVATKERRR